MSDEEIARATAKWREAVRASDEAHANHSDIAEREDRGESVHYSEWERDDDAQREAYEAEGDAARELLRLLGYVITRADA